MKTPRLVILVGISGSGKSTWVKSIQEILKDFDLPLYEVVSSDIIRKELYGDISCQNDHELVFRLAYERIVKCLEAGVNVILDATHVKSKDRVSVLDYIKANSDVMFEAYAKVFDSDPEISKIRLKADLDGGVDRCVVSDKSVDKQYRQLVASIKSIESEGFKLLE